MAFPYRGKGISIKSARVTPGLAVITFISSRIYVRTGSISTGIVGGGLIGFGLTEEGRPRLSHPES